MDKPLIHFSNKPLTSVYSVEQTADPDRKPKGLWVSWGDGEDSWADWCRGEGFRTEFLSCPTIIELAPTARILRLSSAAEIDAFHRDFVSGPEWYRPDRNIRWADVADQHDGIIIAPYIWARRLSDTTGWYYGWDCASGCIWNGDAVAALRVLETAEQ